MNNHQSTVVLQDKLIDYVYPYVQLYNLKLLAITTYIYMHTKTVCPWLTVPNKF